MSDCKTAYNAYLLARFLVSTFEAENLVLSKAGEFFEDYESTKAELFQAWLEHDVLKQPEIAEGLATLKTGTGLNSLPDESIIENALEQIKGACHWVSRFEALREVLDGADRQVVSDSTNKKITDPAYKRLEVQLGTMKKYLLSVLANRGFLPGYGFPDKRLNLLPTIKGSGLGVNRIQATPTTLLVPWMLPSSTSPEKTLY